MDVLELLAREVTPELYREIRELWKAHSIAEDKRDIAGLIATLTPDCVYAVIGEQGARWEGHAGAAPRSASLNRRTQPQSPPVACFNAPSSLIPHSSSSNRQPCAETSSQVGT